MSAAPVVVRVGDLAARAAPDVLVTIGLGSCIAVVLHDAEAGVGGLAHVLLPTPPARKVPTSPGRYAVSAVPALVELMGGLGAQPGRIRARLVGGAAMFANLVAPGTVQMGERNVLAARAVLAELGIPLDGEAVGQDHGRSVEFDIGSGSVRVTSYAHDPQQL